MIPLVGEIPLGINTNMILGETSCGGHFVWFQSSAPSDGGRPGRAPSSCPPRPPRSDTAVASIDTAAVSTRGVPSCAATGLRNGSLNILTTLQPPPAHKYTLAATCKPPLDDAVSNRLKSDFMSWLAATHLYHHALAAALPTIQVAAPCSRCDCDLQAQPARCCNQHTFEVGLVRWS